MQEEHPQIELYIDVGNKAQNSAIEQMLAELPLDQVVKKTLQTAGVQQPIMLTLLITNDDSIRDINKQYRQQDKATDVLSFPLLQQPLVNAPAEQLWIPADSDEGAAAGQEQDAPAFVTPPDRLTHLGAM